MSRQAGEQRGAALIIVLWTALLLSMALAVAMGSARIEAQIAAQERKAFAARQAAIGGLDYAAWRIAAKEAGSLDSLESFRFSLNGYEVEFAPAEESEKLDLSLASETTLASLFRVLGQAPEDADRLAARIADWQDEDDLARPNGAERRNYAAARNGEKIANRPFYSVDEVALVLGMPTDLVQCALPALTIFGDGSPPSPRLMQSLYNADIEQTAATGVRLGTSSRGAAAGRRYAITATAVQTTGPQQQPFALTGVFRVTGARGSPFEWIAQFEQTNDSDDQTGCQQEDSART